MSVHLDTSFVNIVVFYSELFQNGNGGQHVIQRMRSVDKQQFSVSISAGIQETRERTRVGSNEESSLAQNVFCFDGLGKG